MKSDKKLTTASGRPYVENENSVCGVYEDLYCCRIIFFMRKWLILTGSVFGEGSTCKGSGFGTFTVTHDITKYTKAKMFLKLVKNQSFAPVSP
jgi:catalase